MAMVNRYPGRCIRCGGQIAVGSGQVERVDGVWLLSHQGECPPAPLSHHAAGMIGLARVIGGHEFKPDASAAPAGERCARCGSKSGVAWIAGAGEYLCYRHQDDY